MDLRQRQVVALAAVTAAATGMVLILEAFRAFTPSVLFVYGDAGSTPATRLGLYALIPFVAAFLAVPAARWVGVRTTALASAAIVAIARIALQSTAGGTPQLVVSTVLLAAAFGWLVAVGAGALPRRATAFGFVAGLGFDVALHGAVRTVPLVWWDGVAGWVAVFVLLAVFTLATWGAREIEPSPGPAWPWMAIGPVLALHAIVGVHGRLASITDLTPVGVLLILGAAHVLAVASVLLVRREPSRLGGAVAAGLVVLGLYATTSAPMPFDTTAVTAGGQVLLVIGLGLAVGTIGWAAGRRGPLGRGAAAGAGLLLMFLCVFGYYAGHDIRLPVGSAPFLWLAAAVIVLILVLVRPSGPVPGGGWFGPALTLTVVVAVLVSTAAASSGSGSPVAVDGDGFPVRVMTYNVHMGYDTEGRVSIDEIAEVIRSQQPDIVALNEVDRGWLTTGGIDLLPVLADAVGMPYVFAPAADEVWGNALLSRYPLRDVQVDPLPREDTAMRRSALSAIVDVGAGEELGVVVTHLHHVEHEPGPRLVQAERVAAVAQELVASGFPVVVMGDVNAEPGSDELAPLEGPFVNVTVPVAPPRDHDQGPPGIPTYPSTGPVEAIDHVYVSDPLTASDLAVPRSTASDHLGVAVTVERQE